MREGQGSGTNVQPEECEVSIVMALHLRLLVEQLQCRLLSLRCNHHPTLLSTVQAVSA